MKQCASRCVWLRIWYAKQCHACNDESRPPSRLETLAKRRNAGTPQALTPKMRDLLSVRTTAIRATCCRQTQRKSIGIPYLRLHKHAGSRRIRDRGYQANGNGENQEAVSHPHCLQRPTKSCSMPSQGFLKWPFHRGFLEISCNIVL